MFVTPKGVTVKITKAIRNFFLGGNDGRKKVSCLAHWGLVELPKIYGGLGIGNLLHKNFGLLFKWVWRYFEESDTLWRKVVQEKHKLAQTTKIEDLMLPLQAVRGVEFARRSQKILKQENWHCMG